MRGTTRLEKCDQGLTCWSDVVHNHHFERFYRDLLSIPWCDGELDGASTACWPVFSWGIAH